ALWRVLPKELREKNVEEDTEADLLSREDLLLIDRSPLIRLRLNLKKRNDAVNFVAHLIRELDRVEQRRILEEVPLSLSPDGILYLRLDKQEAVIGKIKLLQQTNSYEDVLPPKAEPGHAIQLMIFFKPKLERGKKPSKKRSHIKPSDAAELLEKEGFQK
ncbi:MAG: RNA-binding domain-containing protein, partial [Candidatus Ranarchaeia archaeon]